MTRAQYLGVKNLKKGKNRRNSPFTYMCTKTFYNEINER